VAISHVTKRYHSEGVYFQIMSRYICIFYHLLKLTNKDMDQMVGNRPISVLIENAESTMLEA